MATTIPISIQGSALPPNLAWTPQQLADFIWSKARLVTSETYALFVSGSTEPSSNVGPWLKDGLEWYVWSDSQGGYIPQVLAPSSLGYSIGPDTPDPDLYNFWIETAVGGSPLALKIFYSGSWVDVYETKLADYLTVSAAAATYLTQADAATTYLTQANAASTYAPLASPALTGTPTAPTAAPGTNTTQLATTAFVATSFAPLASPALTGTPTAPTAAPGTNTTQLATTAFVAAAVAGIPGAVAGTANFRAAPSGDQDIVHGGSGTIATDIAFGSENWDPDGVFGSSIFTAPADGYYQFSGCLRLEIVAGSPTVLDTFFDLVSSGGQASASSGWEGEDSEPRFNHGGDQFYLTTGQTVKMRLSSTVDAAATVRVIASSSYFSGFRVR